MIGAAAVLALLAAGSISARAQVDTSKPIVIKKLKPKLAVFKGSVMNVTSVAITVRNQENELLVRTFTYSDPVRAQIQQIIDRGGYQYGDRIKIEFEAGTDVALRIKGKPSKPI